MHTYKLALALSLPLVILGCAKKEEAPGQSPGAGVGTSQSGLMTTSGYSMADVQVAYDRAERIKRLLGPDTPQSLGNAQMALGNILTGIAPANSATMSVAISDLLAAQAQAYEIAVNQGLVSPGVADPGGWDATWWDISSP